MNITTKFSIGQEVYFVYKEDNLSAIQVLKDKINEIVIINENEFIYCSKKICDEFKEENIVDANDVVGLFKKIKELEVEE